MTFFEKITSFFEPKTWWDFFQSPVLQEALKNIINILKLTSFLAMAIFLGIIIWALWKSSWLKWYIIWDVQNFIRGGPRVFQRTTQKKWQKIKNRLKSSDETSWKLAVLEAAKIVERVATLIGLKGEFLKDKFLIAAPIQVPNLEKLIPHSEIYHNILVDPNYKLSQDKAIEIISDFEDFLEYYQYL